MTKRKTPATLGPSRRASTSTASAPAGGVSKYTRVKLGKSSVKPNTAVLIGKPVRRRIGRHVEIAAVIDDLARHPALDDVHPDRRLEVAPHMEEGDREAARPVGPKREIGLEPDPAMGVIVDLVQHLGRGTR